MTDAKMLKQLRRDPAPRIPRTTRAERTDDMRDIINLFAGPGRLDVSENYVLTTLVHHPELARHYLTFNRYLLLSSTLPVRLRQILDFLFTVGAYILCALVFNALRIEREDELLELAERYGAPD
ncbi:MAG TPA: hypothetical protein VFM32_09080 [Spongiibacteraceae bacterium]|nr:hypothetical protein [Spongiibacteraceae bacterium]